MLESLFGSNAAISNTIISALIVIIPALLCITVHELAHGYTAYRLGDSTAKDMGRLTLNPIKHIDPFGLLMMIIFRFGWAKPVPVNMHTFKHPKRYMAITAFAGPLSNLMLALVVVVIYGLLTPLIYSINSLTTFLIVTELFRTTIWLSTMLAVFNLLPIPPLDGSKIFFSLLSEESYYKLMRYERFGIIILIIVLNTPVFRSTIGRFTEVLFRGFVYAGNMFSF